MKLNVYVFVFVLLVPAVDFFFHSVTCAEILVSMGDDECEFRNTTV